MSVAFDVRKLDDNRREEMAMRVKLAKDFTLPPLSAWNYALCRKHRHGWTEDFYDEASRTDKKRIVTDRPSPGCRQCGIHFRRHQRIGIAWLYLRKRCLLADSVGTGKTAHLAGLIAMLHETGELYDNGRVVIVCRSPALLQWHEEMTRMLPGIHVEVAMGTRQERISRYVQHWQVLLIGPQMLLNDYEMLLRFPLSLFATDDIDALRHADTRTAYVLKRCARHADRFVIMTGTPLQKRLHELHSVLEGIGGREAFGPPEAFMRRYVRVEPITTYNHRTGKKTTTKKVVGYKNLGEFRQIIQPMALRRTAADIDDVDLPTIIKDNIFLELYDAQREKYDELKRGVITIMKEEGATVKRATALAKIHYGAQICGGLATLGEADGPGTSVKMDWLMDKLVDGDLSDEKVVVFCNYKATIRALHKRFSDNGLDYETIWGDEPDKLIRKASQDRFWQDPRCKILIGTTALEQSLNLQCSRHLVNVDTILNPARMEQLSGRIRRDGSAFKHVYVHSLFASRTQEDKYLPLLETEQALIDHIWQEESQLFDALNPLALLQLIAS